ncbi:MAG: LPS-assembly protein LptD, partial [Proteobacteria bacterium]|nr:LPS-assembly protein LptD [Pseudomonadota bacterium]
MPAKQRQIKVFLIVLALLLLEPGFSSAQMLTGHGDDREPLPAPVQSRIAEYESYDKGQPVDLSADSLQHDEVGQTITAAGRVEMTQGKRILKADGVVYNLAADTVTARGHVVLTEPNGDVHFADEAQLNNEMKEGFVNGLQTYLAEGGRFTAKEGRREGSRIIMRDAAYTPCECEEDEDGDPAWQIKADEVVYVEDENRIKYKNARFEMFGVPLAWSPYLSHPDGKVKRKSGFLSPQLGFDSRLGVVVTSNYYWNLAPDYDATTGLMMMTDEAPVALGEYRRRFDNAEMKVNGSVTYSDRTESDAGVDVRKDEDFRGHLFADALWDVNEKWRAGTNIELTSDDQYLRQYDFSGQDVLENEAYAERFSGRNYAVGRILAFQDVRVREERADQPNVLPELISSFKGEPNDILGGRWALDLSGLGLERDGNGQDMNRAIAVAGWQRRDVAGFGLVNTVDLSLRGDFYSVRDRDLASDGATQGGSGDETRFFPSAHMVSSYPVVKSFENMQAVVEPLAALTVSPNIKAADSDIPNEDSQDVQLDASNLFEANRFPGFDRIEDGSHATYGMRTGFYGHEGSFGELFLGQSYRFN